MECPDAGGVREKRLLDLRKVIGMGLGQEYLGYVRNELRKVVADEGGRIEQVAEMAAQTIAWGGTCWHSDVGHMPRFEVRIGRAARPSIFSPLVMDSVKPGDLVVLGDQFDIWEGNIELALEARKRGAKVVGIGASMVGHRAEIPTRHSSGKSLPVFVDVFIDTYAPMGDGALTEGLKTAFGATTGVLNSALYWALCGETIERLLKKGVKIPDIA